MTRFFGFGGARLEMAPLQAVVQYLRHLPLEHEHVMELRRSGST